MNKLAHSASIAQQACEECTRRDSKCRAVRVKETLSPDGKYKAVVSEHFCKPETKKILAKHVDIIRVSRNEFETGELVFNIGGDNAINTVWLDASHLRIECPGAQASMIVSQHEKWNELKISYQF